MPPRQWFCKMAFLLSCDVGICFDLTGPDVPAFEEYYQAASINTKKKWNQFFLKCSNGRFKLKNAVLWFFMFIDHEFKQFWRTISMKDEAYSHTSAVCNRKYWLRQRNKHGGATFCCSTVIAQRRRLDSQPEQKLGLVHNYIVTFRQY
jgi:hypothetical protein